VPLFVSVRCEWQQLVLRIGVMCVGVICQPPVLLHCAHAVCYAQCPRSMLCSNGTFGYHAASDAGVGQGVGAAPGLLVVLRRGWRSCLQPRQRACQELRLQST
jgi:hypothetical protein